MTWPAFGPVADDVTATGYPTFTSAGDAVTEVTVPQLNVLPVMSAAPESGAAATQASTTDTVVVD